MRSVLSLCSMAKDLVIDVVYHSGHSWNVGHGWGSDLRRAGLLGLEIPCDAVSHDHVFSLLKKRKSSLVVFISGDHQLHFLHDTEDKRLSLASSKVPKLCLCWESVLHSRFPKAMELTARSMAVFDLFGYSDDRDYEFFKVNYPLKSHRFAPVAISEDAFEHPGPNCSNRERKILFYGKSSDLGFGRESVIYSERRQLLEQYRIHDWFVYPTEYIDTSNGLGDLRSLQHRYTYGIHLPHNNWGFTQRVFEIAAFGSILILPVQAEVDMGHTNQLLKPWLHYIPYHPFTDDPTNVWTRVHELGNFAIDAMSAAARLVVFERHTIRARITDLVNSLL